MLGSLRSEIFKLYRRPAIWLLGLVLTMFVLVFGYLFGYQAVISQRAVEQQGGPIPPGGTASVLDPLLPNSVLSNVTYGLSGGTGAITLILAALVFGSEYGWGTLKTIFTRRPTRLKIFFGKLSAVGIILLGFVIALFAAGFIGSSVVAALEDAAIEWPPLIRWFQAVAAAWLLLAAYGVLGVFLATLFRSSSLAVGLGLAYAVIFESLFLSLQSIGDSLQTIQNVLLGKIAVDLAAFFEQTRTIGSSQRDVDITQDVLIMVLYIIVFTLLAALLVRSRDVN